MTERGLDDLPENFEKFSLAINRDYKLRHISGSHEDSWEIYERGSGTRVGVIGETNQLPLFSDISNFILYVDLPRKEIEYSAVRRFRHDIHAYNRDNPDSRIPLHYPLEMAA